MKRELILCGTIHTDNNGPKRLRRFLKHHAPTAVCLEATARTHQLMLEQRERNVAMQPNERAARAISYLNRQAISQDLRRAINMDTYSRVQMAVGFEHFVSREYCTQRNRPLVLTDSDTLATLADVQTAAAGYHADDFFRKFCLELSEFEKLMKQRYITESDNAYNTPHTTAADLQRNVHMAERIRSTRGKIVVVTGIGHVFGNHPNLYDLLSDLSPARYALADADSL